MFQKPLRTYGRKPKTLVTVTQSSPELTYRRQAVFSPLSPDSSIDFDKYLNKPADNSSDYDPFESTFDRVVKSAKVPPRISKKQSRVHFADSTTDSEEDSYGVIPRSDDRNRVTQSRISSVEKESSEKSDIDSKLENKELTDKVLSPDSSTLDEYLNKSPIVEPRDQSPIESMLDKLESTNLQEVEKDSIPHFVDTTTDSNEEPYELIKIDNQVNENPHITHRKYKSNVNIGDNKTDKIVRNSPVKTRVRKRQIRNIEEDSSDSDQSSKSSPVRKTRRASKISNRISRVSTDSLESDNTKLSHKKTQFNDIKNCCVKLTRLELKENRINNNEDLDSIENDNEELNSSVEDEVKTRECIVRLSRLNNNNNKSKMLLESTLMQTFSSSTPCERRVGLKKLKPGVSPIQNEDNIQRNLTIPPTILLDSSMFSDESSPKKNSEESSKPIGNRLELPEIERTVPSPDLFSSCDDELPNQSIDSSADNIEENNPQNETSVETVEKTTETLVNEDLKSNEMDSKSLTDNSQSFEMEQRSSIDEMVLNEIDEGNFDANAKSFATVENMSIDKSQEENSQDNLTEESKSEKSSDNLVESSEAVESIDECVDNSVPMEVDRTGTTAENMSIDNNNSISIDESQSVINSSLLEDSKNKIDAIDSSSTEEDYHLVVSNTSSNKEDNSTEQSSQEEEKLTENKDPVVKPPEPFVLLERINSLGHVTTRRNEFRSWARDLDNIAEKSDVDLSAVAEEDSVLPELSQRVSRRITRNTKSSLPVRRSTRIKSDSNEPDERPKKSRVGFLEPLLDKSYEDDAKVLYLKPGKSWARSLSILNNIRREEDLDSMSSDNKGKKWRQSVRNVLSMQRQSVVQSCVKDQENEKSDRETFHRDRVVLKRSSNAPKVSLVNNQDVESGAGRFARRMSIRVVPNSNKFSIVNDKIIEDSSFLKVYGISTDKTDEIKKKSLAPKESLIYQLRCSSTPTLDILPEPVSARNVVLQRCGQTDSLPFESCYPDSYLKHCRKIGEGVYGEVFLYDNKREKSVIKIIPIEGNELVNGEPQKKYGEILSEIIIAKELHDLRFNKTYQTNSFVEVKNIRCIKGKYPDKLLQLWDAYDEEKNSENDSPSMFTENQLYIALELGNGGQDMEAFVFNNSAEAYITFVQAALALAVAEKSLDFEHRDMHWGNILISRTNEKQMSCKLGNEEISLQCNGIKTTIIDFTLSRMSYQGCCMFNDLALDPALFTAVGEYQFDIYRLMKEKTKNNWQSFEPFTNILWLHYTLDKMVTAVRYKNTSSKTHKQSIEKLEEIKNIILEYNSAFDFICNCDKLTNLKRSDC